MDRWRTVSQTISVDFDGVLHSYTSKWVSAAVIPDPPVPGAIEWLNAMAEKFEIVVHTTRARSADGREAVALYLIQHGLSDRAKRRIVVSYEKLPAIIYIDDRAWRFQGTFPTVTEIQEARPWNKPA